MGALISQLYELEVQAVQHPQLGELRERLAKLYPAYLLDGPYHVNTKVALTGTYAFLLFSRVYLSRSGAEELDLISSRSFLYGQRTTTGIRTLGMIYGWSVLGYMYSQVGMYPLASYTMQSWTLTTLRYTFGVLSAVLSGSRFAKIFDSVDESIRFPALVQNSVTFIVWWLVLVPILTFSLPAGKARDAFHEWNTSPFLLTVHGLNLPFAVLDHVLAPRKLKLYDLWLGLAVALSYLAFYLRFLDRHGIQLYIILSPRTALSPLILGGILGCYFGLWKGYSKLADIVVQAYKAK